MTMSQSFGTTASATSQILSDLAFDLASTGRDVHIVTSAQIYDDAKAALPVSEIINGVCIGRSEEMEAYVAAALRLSPRDTTAYVWMAGAGVAKLYLGADEAAAAWLHRAIENNRNQAIAHFWLAALAFLGRFDEVRAAAQAGPALDPTFTVAGFRDAAATNNPAYLRQASAFVTACARRGCQRAKARITTVQRLGRKPYHRD